MTSTEIKELRHLLGLTQEQFADAIGVTRRALTYWESGQRKPSPTSIKLIERAKGFVYRRDEP